MTRPSLASFVSALALFIASCSGEESRPLGPPEDALDADVEVTPAEPRDALVSDASSLPDDVGAEGPSDVSAAPPEIEVEEADTTIAPPDALLCPPNRAGEACDVCSGGWSGDACDLCPPNWAGEMCDVCSGGWSGDACDLCPPNWSGEMCDICADAFEGSACDACVDPLFTGPACDECVDGLFTGPACDECADPLFTGPACDVCVDPLFTGPACDVCVDPLFTGPACDVCTDPAFGGPNCDETFRQLWPLSTARSTSNRPVFRVSLVPATLDGARITICAEVTCDTLLLSFDIAGQSGPSPEPLPAGPIYWFAEGLIGAEVASAATPVWQLHIPAHPAPHATAWGSTFDLELDGLADVLIGACGLSGCTELVGLHPGGLDGPSALPSMVITDPMAAASFGFSVSSAGDVNGDGLPDVIVGAGLGDSAHVFLNSSEGIMAKPAQSWQVPGAWFGFSVASAGDVNGDGYGDVIVGSMLGFSAFLYYGGPEGPSGGPDAAISTGAFGFGVSVSSAGDVNGDGYEDVICGAANGVPPEVSLWLGGPEGLDAVASQVLTGEGTFGISTRGAGDLNGDGYADVVVGDPDPGSQRVVAYYGGPEGLSEVPSFSATGPINFGLSVAGAGDLNGDGFGDMVVSAKDMAFIYSGSEIGLVEDTVIALQGPAATQFGDSVAALGDTNGDGFDDLGVGAPSGARAYVFLGSVEGISTAWDVEMRSNEVSEEEAMGYGFTVGHAVR